MTADWASYRGGDVPDLLAGQMDDALDSLEAAVRAREPVQSRLAAIAAAVASLDLQLQHRPPAEVDLARLDLQAAMLSVDAAAGDLPAIRSDVANLDWIRDRIAHTSMTPTAAGLTPRSSRRAAAGDEDLAAVRDIAGTLRHLVARSTPDATEAGTADASPG